MNNQNGQSIILLLIILPYLISFVLAGVLFYKTLLQKSESLHICRLGIIEYQTAQLSGLNSLLQLNPIAKGLRVKRKNAETAYLAAKKSKVPKLIAAALAYKLTVIAEQKAFHLQQKTIIWLAQSRANEILLNTKFNISQLTYTFKIQIIGNSKLKIKKQPRSSSSPDYLVRSQFSKKQNVNIKWENNLLRNTLPLPVSCGATIIRKDNKWKTSLSQVGR